jgi:dipeptidyl aminopeptidase/acylaminoacyl peptidase
MNADGSGQSRLTTNAATDGQPTWSPDGTKIAFWSNRDGNDEIYVMNANGTGQTNVSNNLAGDRQPTWSPDSSRIAFDTDRNGNRDIYVMNANGSGQTRLTTDTADDQNPTWQPGTDTDSDGVIDVADNCRLTVNNGQPGTGTSQLDADHDGYGILCDADLNNSGLVTTADFGILRSVLNQAAGSSATAAAADLNGSGTVTTADFAILRTRLNTLPGPSSCAGLVPCP